MLNKREQDLMEEGAVAKDLADIAEQRKKANDRYLPKRMKAMGMIFLILFLLLVAVGAFILVKGLTSGYWYNIEGMPLYMISGGGMAVLGLLGVFLTFSSLLRRKKKFGKSIMVTPEDDIPEFPQETVSVSSVEDLKQEEEEKPLAVKKIYAEDPEKRVIKMEKKKVERVLDHNISFPKLQKAIISSLSKQKVGIDEKEAALFLGKLAFSRTLFIQGIDGDLQQNFTKGIASALEADCAFLEDSSTALRQVFAENVPAPKPKHSFVLGVANLNPEKAKDFFAGLDEFLADYSRDHSLGEGVNLSMNLILLVYIPEAPVSGVPETMLEKCPVFPVTVSRLEIVPSEEQLKVRCTGDELRYLALRQKSKIYVSDETEELFDAMYNFALNHGFRICNDVENAIEREEAVLLELGLREDTILGSVVAADLVPYFLARVGDSAYTGEGGLKETLEKTFSSDDSSAFVRKALRTLHQVNAQPKGDEE